MSKISPTESYWWFDTDIHEIAIFKIKHLNGYSLFASHVWQISVERLLGDLFCCVVTL